MTGSEGWAESLGQLPTLAGLPLDQQLELLRGVYTNGINNIMDACLSRMALPEQQEQLLEDAAQFIVFLFAVKMLANRRQEPRLPTLMGHFRKLTKRIEKDVPAGFMEFIRASREEPGILVQ